MTVVGDKQLLLTQTLLLADGEVGQFDVPIRDTALPVTVRFSSPEAGESLVHWTFDERDKRLTLDFTGWNNASGSGVEKPQRVVVSDGTPVGFNMAHQRIGSLNVVTIQFYLGGTYE